MDKYTVVKRGVVTYYLSENSILVSVGNQTITYNIYNSPARAGLGEFRKKILNSKEDQYNNALEQMDLARKCNLIGSSIRRPEWMVD
jgi:hypothetical protein